MNLNETCSRKNAKAGITGILIYDEGTFGQVIEGYPESIEKAWDNIRQDPRHKSISILRIGQIDIRAFSNWSLKFCGSAEIDKYVPELKTKMSSDAKELHPIISYMKLSAEQPSYKKNFEIDKNPLNFTIL
jgi:hypothetical protein